MVVRLTFEFPLIFRRRPWMEARFSLVSSLGYTFNSFNSSPLHSFACGSGSFTARAAHNKPRSSSSCPVPVPDRQGEREAALHHRRPPAMFKAALSSRPAIALYAVAHSFMVRKKPINLTFSTWFTA